MAEQAATPPTTPTPPASGDPGQQAGGEGAGQQAQDPKALANQVGFLTRKLQEAEKKLQGFEKADDDRKKAQMSELEKALAERAEALKKAEAAEQRTRDTLVRTRFELAAAKAGAVDTDAAYRLADLAQVTVEADGGVKGLEAAVEALKTSRSFLFGQARAGAVGSGGGNPGGDTIGGKRYDVDAIQRMSADEFRKFEADVAAGRIKIGQ